MDIEACEKIYGKLVKEDEDFYYFSGIGEFGITIPKHAYWNLQPERSKREDSSRDEMRCSEHCGNTVRDK